MSLNDNIDNEEIENFFNSNLEKESYRKVTNKMIGPSNAPN
jgi:hypothetical protein